MPQNGTSKAEYLVKSFFQYALPNYNPLYNYRPDFLRWQHGKNLELDIYYKELGFAVEYNGVGHALEYQQQKDAFKKTVCDNRKIQLLVLKAPQQLLRENFAETFKLFTGHVLNAQRVPHSLVEKIKHYKPKKTWFGRYVKCKKKAEQTKRIQDSEVLANKRRAAIKEMIKALAMQPLPDKAKPRSYLKDY